MACSREWRWGGGRRGSGREVTPVTVRNPLWLKRTRVWLKIARKSIAHFHGSGAPRLSANLLCALCPTSHARMKRISDRCCSDRQAFFFVSLKILTVSQNVVTVDFFLVPTLHCAEFFLRAQWRLNSGFVGHLAVVDQRTCGQTHGQNHSARKSEGAREGASREDEEVFRRLTLTEPARRTVPKETNP